MKLPRTMALLLCALSLSGCYQVKEKFTLNPDRSGKVSVDLVFQPLEFSMTGEKKRSPDEQLRNAIAGLLRESSGVEAWSDVAYNWTKEGKMHFAGTAYFKDIAALEIKDIEIMPVSMREDGGGIVLVLEGKKRDAEEAVKPAPMTEEEIKKAILRQKAEFQQGRAFLAAMLTDLRVEQTFVLPAEVEKTVNLRKSGPNEVQMVLEGAKVLKAIDAFAKDDAYWRSTVIAGSEPFGEMDDRMNEKVFGEKGPIKAVLKGPAKPLFDYKAELAAVKPRHEELMKRFAPAPAVPTD